MASSEFPIYIWVLFNSFTTSSRRQSDDIPLKWFLTIEEEGAELQCVVQPTDEQWKLQKGKNHF